MAKKPTKNKDLGTHDENESTPEEQVILAESVAQSPATSDGQEIEILGAKYKNGDKVTISDQEAIVVEERQLPASTSSGVSAGVYPVVSVLLKPGNRTAYRAVVNGTLYPIREYGTPNQVISKIRGESKPRTKKSKAASAEESDTLTLSGTATKTLDEYLDLKPGDSRSQVVSALVQQHLGPEVERMRAAREAIERLDPGLLAALAGATEEKRQQVLALLK